MKLTPEEISPYLPYGLKVYAEMYVTKRVDSSNSPFPFEDVPCGEFITAELAGIESDGRIRIRVCNQIIKDEPIEDWNILLRPLSDLTYEFFVKEFDYHNTDRRSCSEMRMIFETQDHEVMQDVQFWIVQKLIKHHFDINNLIGQGKAIDLNTIKE